MNSDSAPPIPPPQAPPEPQLSGFVLFGSRTLLVLNEVAVLFALAMRTFVLPRVVSTVTKEGFQLPGITRLYDSLPLLIHILILGGLGMALIAKEILIRNTRFRLIANVLCGVLLVVYLAGLIFALFLPIPAMMESR